MSIQQSKLGKLTEFVVHRQRIYVQQIIPYSGYLSNTEGLWGAYHKGGEAAGRQWTWLICLHRC